MTLLTEATDVFAAAEPSGRCVAAFGEVAMEAPARLLKGQSPEKTMLTEMATIKSGDTAAAQRAAQRVAQRYECKGDCR